MCNEILRWRFSPGGAASCSQGREALEYGAINPEPQRGDIKRSAELQTNVTRHRRDR